VDCDCGVRPYFLFLKPARLDSNEINCIVVAFGVFGLVGRYVETACLILCHALFRLSYSKVLATLWIGYRVSELQTAMVAPHVVELRSGH
jgi:hypothetical protein